MSKEQTPITAEDILFNAFFGSTPTRKTKAQVDEDYDMCKQFVEFSKAYAKAKVLEALEREFMILNNRSGTGAEKEYYETEVKPKYE